VASTPQAERRNSGDEVMELRKEALTMALYVAICLLAALIAVPDDAHVHVTGIVWGVSLGLALAHWFAFRVSARWVGEGNVRPGDVKSGGAQLAGAAGVALLAFLGWSRRRSR
jgi:hypothetical protein